ncbi:ATP-binding cassette domain-containing protein [Actinoplanes philippinensis]|uniref:ATP-binding cassette domain-containing protein n=1 Tax=Actinoplanes philippinensis TaxID=35752 RepID=UPI0033D69F52
MAAAATTLSVRDLVVDYAGRVRAVAGVSLRITAGEVLGLVGESGSGKSTIGRVLAGLTPVPSGAAEVAGTDIARLARHPWRNARALRRARSEIGIVFQDPASSLTPRRTIAEPLVLHRDLTPAQRDARVGDLLDAVQLPDAIRHRYPYEMSGGQRQRVAIRARPGTEPGPADRRRADQRPRRLSAGPHPRPVPVTAGRLRLRVPFHQS